MGMAKLNVWVSGLNDPCSISDRTWYVTIYNCDGEVLEWCNRRYVVLPAKCGHLEVEVPPGCYYIKAVWSFRISNGVFYGNHFTDAAIVQACCEQTTCITLFNPSTHRCGIIFQRAIRDLILQKAIRPKIGQAAEKAIGDVLQFVPQAMKGFELNHLDEIEELVRRQEGVVRDEEQQDEETPEA